MTWEKVGSDVESGPMGALKWFLIIFVILTVIGTGTRYLGMWGNTVMERVVMKNSFQYVEGMEQRAAILQANISEVDIKLRSNPENKQDLENQRMILNGQLKAITINQ